MHIYDSKTISLIVLLLYRKLEKRQKEAECGNFYEMVKPFQISLRSDDLTTQEDTITNLDWIELYLETLEHIDDAVAKLVAEAVFRV